MQRLRNTIWTGPAVICVLLSATRAANSQTPTTDPVQREMEFIEKSGEATDLYNEGKYDQALAIFQSLVQSYLDLDTEGFARIGVGDCLAAMGRVDEARAAYLSVPVTDAKQRAGLGTRLAELELKAPITEPLLDRLRAVAQQPGAAQFDGAWRLGRALQKRALDYLAETTQSFRNAAQAAAGQAIPVEKLLNHAAYLQELLDDLKFLVEETEGGLKMPRNIGPRRDDPDKPVTSERQVRAKVTLPDGRQVLIELEGNPGGDAGQVKVDGQGVTLSPAVRRLVQRHLDRINALILDSAEQKDRAADTTRK